MRSRRDQNDERSARVDLILERISETREKAKAHVKKTRKALSDANRRRREGVERRSKPRHK